MEWYLAGPDCLVSPEGYAVIRWRHPGAEPQYVAWPPLPKTRQAAPVPPLGTVGSSQEAKDLCDTHHQSIGGNA